MGCRRGNPYNARKPDRPPMESKGSEVSAVDQFAGPEEGGVMKWIRWSGLVAGPLAALLVALQVPAELVLSDGQVLELGFPAMVTSGLAVWMALWWLSEAISIYVTALLPLAVLPLAGVRSMADTAGPYAHPLIFLFLGGFILALALERWDLHRRFALFVLRLVGVSPRRLVAGFMLAAALLSMWITNTATAIVMLPMALSIIALLPPSALRQRFGICLLLGIAYAASIGGIGTIVGTTPNLFAASFIRSELGYDISFAQWMSIGIPLVVVLLPLVWLLMTRVLLPLPDQLPGGQIDLDTAAAPWQRGAVLTLLIFAATALAWISLPLLNRLPGLGQLTDTGVAVMAAIALFTLPVDVGRRQFLLDWETAVRVPWGVLLLMGGGLSLAAAIGGTGVTQLVAQSLAGMDRWSPLLVTLAIVALIVFLTELTSNIATTTALVPMIAALGVALGMEPLKLVIPATMAASCAFMLPVATPPNAVIFGARLLSIPQMARVGFWVNLVAIVAVTLVSHFAIELLLF